MNEAQREWQREAQTYQEYEILCFHCGNTCTGEITEDVEIMPYCYSPVPVCGECKS